MGVTGTGLSDREDEGEGEVETLESVDEMEDGLAVMIFGEEIRFVGGKLDKVAEASSVGVKTIWD